MNPGQGRFVGMDSYMGSTSDPTSLHKYLYANASPMNYTDPSGNFGLIDFGTAFTIIGIGSTAINASFINLDFPTFRFCKRPSC